MSLGLGQARSGGGWLLAQLGRAVPASVLERKGILEMVGSSSSLGTRHPVGEWREYGVGVRPRL